MPHVVLLGDSIFDNAAYVAGGADVIQHLRRSLPHGWIATLAAVDGAVARDVEGQLPRIPADATHLVLSVGGNDALGHVDVLERPARSVAEVLDLLAELRQAFDVEYRAALGSVLERRLPVTLCTVYEGALPDSSMQRRASTALTVFNDVILRSAFELGLTIIDLRVICRLAEDYANPIEPSVVGGARIADAIVRAVTDAEPGARVVV